MNVSSRVSELMLVPMKDVPAPAIAYVRHLGKKYGICGEVFVTAFAHYAECFEGAEKSDDSLYVANDEARAFFAGYRAATETIIPKGWQLVTEHDEMGTGRIIVNGRYYGLPMEVINWIAAALKYEEQSK